MNLNKTEVPLIEKALRFACIKVNPLCNERFTNNSTGAQTFTKELYGNVERTCNTDFAHSVNAQTSRFTWLHIYRGKKKRI